MFKYFLFLVFLIFPPTSYSSDDAISQFVYGYLKRINDFIDDEKYEDAQRELDICLLYTSPSPRDS